MRKRSEHKSESQKSDELDVIIEFHQFVAHNVAPQSCNISQKSKPSADVAQLLQQARQSYANTTRGKLLTVKSAIPDFVNADGALTIAISEHQFRKAMHYTKAKVPDLQKIGIEVEGSQSRRVLTGGEIYFLAADIPVEYVSAPDGVQPARTFSIVKSVNFAKNKSTIKKINNR